MKGEKGIGRGMLEYSPDIGGVGGPGEGGVRNGNIVDQAIIEEPIGVFPGNHYGASEVRLGFPGKLKIFPHRRGDALLFC